MKYTKRPVAVEALQWTGHNHRQMYDFLTGTAGAQMEAQGDNFYIDFSKVVGGLVIKTLEGEHKTSVGDYIIKGVNGEYYPCKPDIFLATYDVFDPAAQDNENERSDSEKTFENHEFKWNNLYVSTKLLVEYLDKQQKIEDELCKHKKKIKALRKHIKEMEDTPVKRGKE